MKKFILLPLFLLFFNGCVLINEGKDSFKLKYFQPTHITNFSSLVEELFEGVEKKMFFLDKRNPIYVIDFVNLKDLEHRSHLGFMLSEEIKTQVTQKLDIPVVSIEYMKYLKFGKDGSKFLTRDVSKIRNSKINTNTYALVGTYTFTQRQLIIYLKLIDLTNGVILKSSTVSARLTDEIIEFELKKQKEIAPVIFKPMTL